MNRNGQRPLKVGAFIPVVEREMDGGSATGADVLAMARRRGGRIRLGLGT